MYSATYFFAVFLLLGNTAILNTDAQIPTLVLVPERPVYIVGESLSLRCNVGRPTTIIGYNFYRDEVLLTNNSASNRLTISSLSIKDNGMYFCTYYNTVEVAPPGSNSINLKVFERPPAPTLSVEPQRNAFTVNESVVIRCHLPRGQTATEVNLYRNSSIIYESDDFGVLSIANTEKKNSGSYTCQYKIVISGRTVDSNPSNQETLVVIDLPPTPILRYGNNVQNKSGQVEIVCEIPNPSSLIHGYHLYRNGGEIATSRQMNQFVINYSLDFDGCYSCRSFVNILGEEILSPKSTEVFLTLEEGNRRSCQDQDSPNVYGLSRQGIKLYGSVLIGKLIVLISILLFFGIYLLIDRQRSNKSEAEELSFRRL